MRNAHDRKAAAERTVRDYAMFASYLYTTRAYLFARERAAAAYDRPIHPGAPWKRSELPPVTALAAIPDTMEMCGPREKFPIYRFRIDLPSRAITYAGGRPAPEIEKIIRDSIPILANASWVRVAGFGYLFVDAPGGRKPSRTLQQLIRQRRSSLSTAIAPATACTIPTITRSCTGS